MRYFTHRDSAQNQRSPDGFIKKQQAIDASPDDLRILHRRNDAGTAASKSADHAEHGQKP